MSPGELELSPLHLANVPVVEQHDTADGVTAGSLSNVEAGPECEDNFIRLKSIAHSQCLPPKLFFLVLVRRSSYCHEFYLHGSLG